MRSAGIFFLPLRPRGNTADSSPGSCVLAARGRPRRRGHDGVGRLHGRGPRRLLLLNVLHRIRWSEGERNEEEEARRYLPTSTPRSPDDPPPA